MSDNSFAFNFLRIWYQPRATVAELIASGRGHGIAVSVAALFGVLQATRFYLSGELFPVFFLLVGAVSGVFGLYLFAWLLRNFGRWFGSSATVAHVRTVVGFSLIPLTLLFGLLVLAVFLVSDVTLISQFYFLFFAGLIYGYIILLLAISTALQLTVLKAFLCLVVTILFSIFPITLLIQLLGKAF